MPLIRCQKCNSAYDVPGVIAVRLPNSIATCECGEWISGSKAALLARLMNPEDIKEIDLKPYKVDRTGDTPPTQSARPPCGWRGAGSPAPSRGRVRGVAGRVKTLGRTGNGC